jgi:hypothetical protein
MIAAVGCIVFAVQKEQADLAQSGSVVVADLGAETITPLGIFKQLEQRGVVRTDRKNVAARMDRG